MGVAMLLFSTNENYYALSVDKIVRVLWALEVTFVQKSPKVLYGVFDLHGKTLPVVSIRELLSLGKKEMELEDALIVLDVHSHQMALLVYHVVGVYELEEEDSSEASELFKELETTHIVKYEERLVPILDIDALVDAQILGRLSGKGD